MKTAGAIVALVLSGAIFWYVADRAQTPAPVRAAAGASLSQRDIEQLTAEIESLRREVGSLESRLAESNASRPGQPSSDKPRAPHPREPSTAEDIAAIRAMEAEQHREYVAGVAQSFAGEKIDSHWAGNTAALVESVFAGDETLRTLAHQVQCRERTCRLEITSADRARLRERLPAITLGLAASLPTVTAEEVQQPDGRTTTVLYMSSQSTSRVVAK